MVISPPVWRQIQRPLDDHNTLSRLGSLSHTLGTIEQGKWFPALLIGKSG
jgi:hypothetical protein